MKWNAPSNALFCVTLVDFTPVQVSEFQDALRQTENSLQITVRHVNCVSDTSYSSAVIQAIVLTQKAIERLKDKDVDTIRSAASYGTCRIYFSDEDGHSATPEENPIDNFIQQTRDHDYAAVANEIIFFFQYAGILNRRSTLLAVRDMTCLVSYRLLKYLWPISYVVACIHILNATINLLGYEIPLGQHAKNYFVSTLTFFGFFFILHCFFVVVRNWLFAVRIAKRGITGIILIAASIGMATVLTIYSLSVTSPSISRISVSAILAVVAYAFYMYARRIRSECTSLSKLQEAIVDPQRCEGVLRGIGRQRFTHSSFSLFPFCSRALFISYMHGSQWSSDTADLIMQWASKDSREVFIDRSIPSGTLWRQSLIRAASECGFFVAVIDGDSEITDWVQAELAYAATLRKSIGKPRVLLVVKDTQRITEDIYNPVQLIFLDVFQLPPGCSVGAAILSVDRSNQLTKELFFKALGEVCPMSLLRGMRRTD